MKYRIYVDEVGNSDLESSTNPNHRYLSLTGVVIDLDYVKNIVHPDMEELKTRFFNSHPDDPIIFHRKELLGGKPPFQNLKNADTRIAFDTDLLRLLTNWQYNVITVCIDKLSHKETYSVWRYDPYHYCLEVLLERYVMFLEQKNAAGDMMAESRGYPDIRLKKSFERLWNTGTDYIDSSRMQAVLTSKKLKVKPKANNVAGLQIADLIAHPSRNEILMENAKDGISLRPFGQRIVDILQEKYYQNSGRIFGKKMLG